MAEKEFVFKVKVVDESGNVVEKTAKNFQDLNSSLSSLKKELESADFGSEKWNQLNEEIQKTENTISDATEKAEKMKETQKSLGDTLGGIPGPVGQVVQGIKGLGTAFKALIANPVGLVLAAIAAALTLLYKAFTSTKAGAEKMEQVFAGIGAVVDVLRDRFLVLAGAIKKLFTLDFSGFFSDLKSAFTGVGDEIEKEFKAAAALKAELQAVEDATRELNKTRAEQNKKIAEAKLVINDETKSIGERQKALEEVRQAEISLAKQEEILAQRRYEAIKAQNALSDSSKEALDEEAAAYVALQNAQLASLQKQKELFDQQKALRDKERAEQKAAADKRKAELKAAFDFETQLRLDNETDANKRAKKEVELNRTKLLEQLNDLKISNTKKQELTLLIEANTAVKRQQIETESYLKSLTILKEFRAKLIAEEIVYSDSVVKLAEDTAFQQLQLFDEIISAEYDVNNGREKFIAEFEQRTSKNLKAVEQAYKNYYDTLIFQAKQAYAEDIQLGEQREAERKFQNEEAEQVRDKELKDIRLKAREGVITREEAAKQILEAEGTFQVRQKEIRDYFDNYEVNRKIQLDAQIVNLENEKTNKLTGLAQKVSDFRKKISDQEAAAEQERMKLAVSAFDTLSSLAGQESDLGKALAVASTTISTYQAAQAAYASQLTIPTPDAPVRAAIAAGIAIAQGLARVAQIVKVEPVKAAEGGIIGGVGSDTMDNIPAMLSNGESVINAKSTRMFAPLLSTINQLGGGKSFQYGGLTSSQTQVSPQTALLNDLINLQSGAPTKAYVVANDVYTQSQLDRQVRSRSVL